MRYLVVLRGVPACGKSTWVKENKLEPYTVSTDAIRLLLQSPIMTIDGDLTISQQVNNRMGKLLNQVVEERMQRGEFIVVDATHAKPKSIHTLKNLVKQYRYRACIVDFTEYHNPLYIYDVKERNFAREPYKRVPEYVIDTMYETIVKNPIKDSSFPIYAPNSNELRDFINPDLTFQDFSEYDSVVVFGDIHGCYEPLKNYFTHNPYSEKTLYIFTGDYLDRGLENEQVMSFMLSIYDKPNVICLEGNHEKWLCYFASKNADDVNKINSDEFLNGTAPQLSKFDKKDLRMFCRKLRQYSLFIYDNKKYVVTHAGVPNIPTKYTHCTELVKGVGTYGDIYVVETNFKNNTEGVCQIHGHRNPNLNSISEDDVNFNLCDEVEFGGELRLIVIDHNSIEPHYYLNTKFGKRNEKSDIFQKLDNSRLIKKSECSDGIVSYNFTREAFYGKRWNSLTCTARGLFVKEKTVVGRGYPKFFNIGELASTSLENLCKNMKFPVKAYLKENGFLGLVSVIDDEIRVFTKSRDNGPYVNYLKAVLEATVDYEKIKNVAKSHNLTNHTFIFECVDIENDPHIIEYESNRVVLLDIVENNLEDKFVSYESLVDIAKSLGVKHKLLESVIETPKEFLAFYKKYTENMYELEGFVIEDAVGFRTKLKTDFYKMWKRLRGDMHSLVKTPTYQLDQNRTLEEKDVFQFMQTLEVSELTDIISVRNKYRRRKCQN